MAHLNPNKSFRTSSLFKETLTKDQKDRGIKHITTLAKAKKVYLEAADPTEYRAAMEICDGSWEQWLRLQEWDHFNDTILNHWRSELEVKMRSDAILGIVKDSKNDDSKKQVDSCKWVAEGKWKGSRGPGRPTDKQKNLNKKTEDNILSIVNKDTERLINR